MDCVICWEGILTPDADTFCGRESHGICAPCFFYMRRLHKDQCPVCRGSTGGTRSRYTVRLEAVLNKEENREEYLFRVRDGICQAVGRLLLGLYLFVTVLMIAISLNVAFTICTK